MTATLDLFRALADFTRLRIVHLLGEMELAVGEIAQVVGQSQPRVSRHVRILVDAGIVERRKEGSWVFLTLARAPAVQALTTCLAAIPPSDGELLWRRADLTRLAAVRADRAAAAERYFAVHAEQWDAIRSLHAPEAEVEAAMQAMLADAPIGSLIDIGTGTGRMVALFGPSAERVTAIDRNADMLRLARAKLDESLAAKSRLEIGDFCDLPLAAASQDTAVLHQVLHYAPAPDRVIGEAARVLRHGGRLLIADFAPHDRETLRTEAAHARLGFSDEQIAGWFAQAGLVHERVETLGGGALTVKLWLGRRRGGAVIPLEGRERA